MGEPGMVCLEKEMDAVLISAIPSSWRLIELITLFKGKGPIMECSNF